MFEYLETGVLPEDAKAAKKLVMTESQYTIQDGVLYHVESDGTLPVFPPASHREKFSKKPMTVGTEHIWMMQRSTASFSVTILHGGLGYGLITPD